MAILTPEAPGRTRAPEPAEKVTPLKLSEYIRLGAMDTYFTEGLYNLLREHGKYGACAIGAAWLAYSSPADIVSFMGEHEHGVKAYNWVDTFDNGAIGKNCPVTKCQTTRTVKTLSTLIFHLNDDHGWERTEIARYLEGHGL